MQRLRPGIVFRTVVRRRRSGGLLRLVRGGESSLRVQKCDYWTDRLGRNGLSATKDAENCVVKVDWEKRMMASFSILAVGTSERPLVLCLCAHLLDLSPVHRRPCDVACSNRPGGFQFTTPSRR